MVDTVLQRLPFVLLFVFLVYLPYLAPSDQREPSGMAARWVIALAAVMLGVGVQIISTAQRRRRFSPNIFVLLGPSGPVVYCELIVLTAAVVMASFIFMLFSAELVELKTELQGG